MRTDVEGTIAVTSTGPGWLVEAADIRFEVEQGLDGGWRVTSQNGRERIGNSLAQAVASVCRIDPRTTWLLMLEELLTGSEEHAGTRLSPS
jgi:hypothetical protein